MNLVIAMIFLEGSQSMDATDCTNVVIRKEAEWTVVDINDRVDSFNNDAFKHKLQGLLDEKVDSIAFNLAPTYFLSFASIKALGEVAKNLRLSGGRAVLLAPSEKLKRQSMFMLVWMI